MTTPEENKRIVTRIREEVVDRRDLDAVEEIFAEDAVAHGPMREFSSHDEIKESFEMNHEAFSDYSLTVEEMIAEGDTVAVRMTERGTHDGALMGIEPTGNEFEHQTMSFLHLEDGKIAEWWILPDMFGFIQQLGLEPEDIRAAVPADDD
jgi:steroid delta-isomerase-like uncharacterized protein